MSQLRLSGPIAVVRQIDSLIWKVIPAPYMNTAAFYAVPVVDRNTTPPVIKPVDQMAAENPSHLGFKTMVEAKRYLNTKVGDFSVFEFGSLLYGDTLWDKVNDMIEIRQSSAA